MMANTDSSVEGGALRGQRWLRPATDKEEYFALGQQKGYFQIVYSMDLTSSRPLHEDLIRRALIHLYRKVPVLRVCLGRRDGRLWLREMDDCVLDFKIVEDGEENDEEEKLTDYTLNTAQGPLWCVRFIPATGGHGGVLLLAVHHTVTDGFTIVRICHFVHTILDDLTAGRSVDDEEQLGELVADEQALLLYENEKQRLLQDPDLYKRRNEELMSVTNIRSPLLSVLPPPRVDGVKSRSVKLVLDESTTQAFRKTCKAEGVSVHCGLVGVINVAMVRMLEALPDAPAEYNFVCSHDINLRRYYEGDASRILGPHIPTFSYRVAHITPKDVIHNFWPYVQENHRSFHAALKERAPLQAVAIKLMDRSKKDNFKECFSEMTDPECSYIVSNMGDVTTMLPGNGDFVQVTKLTPMSALRCYVTLLGFYVHTFRGQLNLNAAYSTRFMTRNTVQQLLDYMHETITSLSQERVLEIAGSGEDSSRRGV